MSEPFDVIAIGRLGVDVYPQQVGVSLREVETFGKYLGGSAANVAVAAARHGRRTALVSRTGDDPFGAFLHDALRGFGVDDRWVTAVQDLPTPVTFCEIFPPDDFPLYFYRRPKAPDMEIAPDELDLDAIRAARVLWVTGTGLSDEPSRAATLAALEARGRRGITVLDLDWRPVFWRSPEEGREQMQRALAHATVAVGNLDEVETAVGEREPRAAAAALRALGVELAVVKQGPRGVLASGPHGEVEVPPVPVEVVNGLGAGDAFGGALCHGLLAGWGAERIMRFANAAGAIVASRLACSDAMPTTAEVEELLAGGAGMELTALRIIEGSDSFETGEYEAIVLPLEGSCEVTCDGETFALEGRESVFDAVSDFAYVPRDARVELSAPAGGRFALPAARATRRLPARYGAAADVPVELRGAGQASRQINNFCGADTFEADRLIAVEVLTPEGNWSSYPPHKHDEDVPGVESALEEIYYFEVAGGGFGFQRAYGPEIDVCTEVRSGDTVFLPSGYHGPSMAAPGYDLYYLNVMAGHGERTWLYTDDPQHAWIRDTWQGQPIDPRLPLTQARRHA